MITYWKETEGLVRLEKFEKNSFIKVISPNPQETASIINQFDIPEDLINDILDVDELSRLEVDGDKLLIILRIPVHNPDNGVPFSTIPLGFILAEDYVMAICQKESETLASVFTNRTHQFSLKDKMDFLLSVFLQNSKMYHNYLKKINIQIGLIEQDLEKSTKNRELHKLLKMEKCLVYFITSLRSNELLFAKIRNSRYINKDSYTEELLEDVMIENKQAIEMANIYSDIQSGMMDAFASVISNNLNNVMKQLTIVTIILMIPTLIASFFGMNINNSFENSRHAFAGILVASIIISVIAVLLIRSRKWI